MSRNSTFDFIGVQTVKINNTEYEKLPFTAELTAVIRRVGSDYEGFNLPIMLSLCKILKSTERNFSSRKTGGTMTRSFRSDSYIPQISCRRHVGYFKTSKTILIMNSAKSHLGDNVGNCLKNERIDTKYILCSEVSLLLLLAN